MYEKIHLRQFFINSRYFSFFQHFTLCPSLTLREINDKYSIHAKPYKLHYYNLFFFLSKSQVALNVILFLILFLSFLFSPQFSPSHVLIHYFLSRFKIWIPNTPVWISPWVDILYFSFSLSPSLSKTTIKFCFIFDAGKQIFSPFCLFLRAK